MNRQFKNSQRRGIEWTDWTWNPIGGCLHGCTWTMPDGSTAGCYAQTVADSIRRQTGGRGYANGFQAHYWHPERLNEPFSLKESAKIFLDSMSDLMGHWVPAEQIRAVLDVCRRADWHSFQLLTKNPSRLLEFKDLIPPNVWIGASMPPTAMWGNTLSREQQVRLLLKTLRIFGELSGLPNVLWMSLEPLSFDIAPMLAFYNPPLRWLVIGAASNRSALYQPDPSHVQRVLDWADEQHIPVFFKGNLQWEPHREQWPGQYAPTEPGQDFRQATLF